MKIANWIVLFSLYAFLAVTLLFIVPVKPWAAEELGPPLLPIISDDQFYDQIDYSWNIRHLNGETVGLSTFKNKVVFFHFWATWCPHCEAQMYSMQLLYESLRDKEHIEFIMASNQDHETVQKYISKKKIRLPIYLHKRAVPPVLGPSKRIPRTFIINRTGQIVYKHIGPAKWDDESVVEFLESLL